MKNIIAIIQLIISVVLVGLILIQKGKGTGQLVGSEGQFYRTLRGAEKNIFWGTAILGGLFIILGIINLTL